MALTTACTVSVSIYQPPCHDEELGAMAVLVKENKPGYPEGAYEHPGFKVDRHRAHHGVELAIA